MTPERELVWLIILRNSPDLSSGWFKRRDGTKKSFERILGAPNNSKEFHEWFTQMLDEGCIKPVPEAENRFVVDRKEIDRLINLNFYNNHLHAYYNRDRVI